MNICMTSPADPPERISERKIWKQSDDDILKELFEVRKIRKWSEISRIMQEQFGIGARNGKQCRERYHNHLRGGINKEKWTAAEEDLLISLHAQHGNRWALISKCIAGRTENCVKNMLYSRLRKAIRQLNRFVFLRHRKEMKEIKLPFVYRLIQFTQNAYKRDRSLRNQMELEAIRLKNQVLKVDLEEGRELSEEESRAIKALIEQIHAFKRKNQRFRGNLAGAGKAKNNIASNPSQTLHSHSTSPQKQVKIEDSMEAEPTTASKNSQKDSDPHCNNEFSSLRGCCEEKRGLPRMDSLDSSFSFHHGQVDLEMPIQIDLVPLNLTSTGIFEEWGDLGNAWNPNFYY